MTGYLQQALRSWRSAKAPAALAILALAAGIGSTTIIFTVINGLMLRPVPYDGGDRWMTLLAGDSRDPDSRSSLGPDDIFRFRQATSAFDFVSILTYQSATLTAPGSAQRVEVIETSPESVNSLGIHPRLGAWFTALEETPVAVISHALWQRLGADPAIIGKSITVKGVVRTVTGVMPSGFRFPIALYAGDILIDVWIPLDRQQFAKGSGRPYFGIVRRKPGLTVAAAVADARRVAAQIAKDDPVGHPYFTAHVDGMLEIAIKEVRSSLLLVFAAACVLLLITCANVASLLVARSVDRARETALRVALGAGAGQLALQHLCEGMVLAASGAVCAFAAAHLFLRILIRQTAAEFPLVERITIDGKVFLFVLGAACLATVIPAMAPLWQALRTSPADALSAGVRASSGARTRKLAQRLVVLELGLSFVLMALGVVLVSRLRNLQHTAPGFNPNQLVTFDLSGEPNHHRAAFLRQLVGSLQSIPGVSAAAASNQLPLAGCCYITYVFPRGSDPNYRPEAASYLLVTPGYFSTMGIPLRRGRLLQDNDTSEDLLRVVINEAAARLYWPGIEPVGAMGRIGGRNGSPIEVVGVIGNVRSKGLGATPVPEVYLHAAVSNSSPMKVMLRTALTPAALSRDIKNAVAKVDKDLPVSSLTTGTDILVDSLKKETISSWLTGFFALAALIMSTLGIYGVVSSAARQRTIEIGTRTALGAQSSDILRMVLASGWKMSAGGILLGVAAYIACVPVLARELSISGRDPLPVLVASIVVASVTLAASFFPAWRASLVSPLVSIRGETTSLLQAGMESGRLLLRAPKPLTDPALSSGLSADFVQASRQAATFRDALHLMLSMLCRRAGAQWALLLERAPNGSYVPAASHQAEPLTLSAAGFLAGRMRAQSAALPFRDADWESIHRWAAEQRPDHAPEIARLRELQTRLAMPLRAGRELPGIVLLGPLNADAAMEPSLRNALQESAVPFALMLENVRLTDRILEQEKLDAELKLAADVQRRLLPQRVPISTGATFAAVSIPARSVGGDSYDFLNNGHGIGIAIADVAGKGVAAALLTSMVQASLRLIASENTLPLSEVVARMNRFLKQSIGTRRGSFATFFYATFDDATQQLRYVNAGHNPPYLIRNGALITLPPTGLVIGMFDKAAYEERVLQLQAGDLLFLYTDGVTEARNPAGEDYGEDRLEALLKKGAALPVEELAAQVSEGLQSWMDAAPAHDDITFIAVKVTPKPRADS